MGAEETSSKGRGCWIVVGVLGVLGLLALGGAAWVVARVAQNPAVQKAGKAFGKGIEIADKGRSAPGADEVRAAGCERALVIDSEDVVALQGLIHTTSWDLDKKGPVVFCKPEKSASPPSCEKLASTYLSAVSAAPPLFYVLISGGERKRKSGLVCLEAYNQKGTRISRESTPAAP